MRKTEKVHEDLIKVTTMPNRFMKKLEVEMLLDIRDTLGTLTAELCQLRLMLQESPWDRR